MIKSIKFHKEFIKNTRERYGNLSKTLDKKINFSSGFNLVVGICGEGKSLLLERLAMASRCYESAVPFSKPNHKNVFWKKDKNSLLNGGVESLEMDKGFTISYFKNKTPDQNSGGPLVYSILNDFDKLSSGSDSRERIYDYLEWICNPEKLKKLLYGHDFLKNGYDNNVNGERKLLIIDEPETGMPLIMQMNVLADIYEKSKEYDFQVIMASHSPCIPAFLHKFTDVNVIELESSRIRRGYIEMLKLSIAEIYHNMGELNG